MPLLGLGTWLARGKSAEAAVVAALELGYRHVDTASAYRNEEQVGRALAESGIPRDDVFVTTKMWPDGAGRERATLEASLAALGLARVDLWLIHWPPAGQACPDIWERFLEAEADGLARTVGVSRACSSVNPCTVWRRNPRCLASVSRMSARSSLWVGSGVMPAGCHPIPVSQRPVSCLLSG